jgi:D-alanyl-D-alanine carboxypeptidase
MINFKKAIGGVLLSFVFLAVFIYAISCTSLFLDGIYPKINKESPLGSVSSAVFFSAEQPAVSLDVDAKAAMSVKSYLSGENKIIFEKFSEEKFPIASLAKLMTAIIVLDSYNLEQTIMIGPLANSQPPLKQDLQLADSMAVKNLLEVMLIKSSNKAAYALSELMGQEKFIELMNKKAKEIDMTSTVFVDSTGLSSQNVSAARDLIKLTNHILKNYPKIADISSSKEFFIEGLGVMENTDQLLNEMPEIVYSKTGFTTEAKGCLLLAIKDLKNDGYFINVILGADDRFLEMKKLINLNTTHK